MAAVLFVIKPGRYQISLVLMPAGTRDLEAAPTIRCHQRSLSGQYVKLCGARTPLPPTEICTERTQVMTSELVAVSDRYLCWMCRQVTHGEHIPPEANWQLALASNYLAASIRTARPASQRWSKFDVGFLNLNVDAAFYEEERVRARGAILRD